MKKAVIIATIISIIIFTGWFAGRIYKDIIFGINCNGHLKRAADANTVSIAEKELQTALNYMKANGLTTGYTSILYRTPDEDIGFWYTNLTASLIELQSISAESTQLERSNILMKLRETILDDGEHGSTITTPSGISIYPHNTAWMLWGIISFILNILGACYCFITSDYYF